MRQRQLMMDLLGLHIPPFLQALLTQRMLRRILIADPFPCPPVSAAYSRIPAVLLVAAVLFFLVILTEPPSGSGIPDRNTAASVFSAILPPPSGIKKALGNRFLKALSFYFPHLNSIILPYCISIAFTANFQGSRFFSASRHGAGTLSSYSCSAL